MQVGKWVLPNKKSWQMPNGINILKNIIKYMILTFYQKKKKLNI